MAWRTGLVATRGFRDILELRRSSREDVADRYVGPEAAQREYGVE